MKTWLSLLAICSSLLLHAAPPADALMKVAQDVAKKENKNIFLVFSTSNCGWCKVLKAFVESDEIRPVFGKYFLSVQIMLGDDAQTNPGGKKYSEKYGATGGVPFHLFIKPDGALIVDSRADGTGDNIGYPAAPHEIAWFMAMIKKAAPDIAKSELDVIESKLRAYKPKRSPA